MKKKHWFNGLTGLILILTALPLHANFIAKATNTHTISFNDNQPHTLLETGVFHGAHVINPPVASGLSSIINGIQTTTVGGAHGDIAIIMFNAECNVDANESGVWLGVNVQFRQQNINAGVWSNWQTVDSSNNNDALCSSHGSDAPLVRVSASTNNTQFFNDDSLYQVRVRGSIRDGVGAATIDDSSLFVIN